MKIYNILISKNNNLEYRGSLIEKEQNDFRGVCLNLKDNKDVLIEGRITKEKLLLKKENEVIEAKLVEPENKIPLAISNMYEIKRDNNDSYIIELYKIKDLEENFINPHGKILQKSRF
ncbi:MAG: hypothetical protein IJ568_00500 [Bacilli bacterium]|nr:hypothetical protein [Bacilli bacterium]